MLGQLAAPKNLCILRLSAIGDVCNAIAAVQNIQKQWPHTQITWVCGEIEANLLRGLEKIEVIVFDKSAGLQGYSDFRHCMKNQFFDILLNMQVTLSASLVSFFIPAKTKIGFDTKRAKKGQWLFTHYKISSQKEPHILDDFMGFTQVLGLKVNEPKWNMPLTANDEKWAQAVSFSENKKPIVVINPAASKTEGNWHVEGYAQTANYLDEIGFQVVLCGGDTAMEIQLAKDICQQSKVSIANLVAKISLKQLLSIFKVSTYDYCTRYRLCTYVSNGWYTGYWFVCS